MVCAIGFGRQDSDKSISGNHHQLRNHFSILCLQSNQYRKTLSGLEGVFCKIIFCYFLHVLISPTSPQAHKSLFTERKLRTRLLWILFSFN